MDTKKITENFVNNFINKGRRERSLFELNHSKKRRDFIGRFNHSWATLVDMRKMIAVPQKADQYKYIKENLQLNDSDLSYIISNYPDIDDKLMEFNQAFNKSWGRGFATLIISLNADKIYLETEQVQGSPYRFIGKV